MLGLLIEYPYFALVPALLLALAAAWWRSRTAWIAAGLWGLYFIYEMGMHERWLCSGECNIRVDLLLVYPVLALVTLMALVQLYVRRRDRRRQRRSRPSFG